MVGRNEMIVSFLLSYAVLLQFRAVYGRSTETIYLPSNRSVAEAIQIAPKIVRERVEIVLQFSCSPGYGKTILFCAGEKDASPADAAVCLLFLDETKLDLLYTSPTDNVFNSLTQSFADNGTGTWHTVIIEYLVVQQTLTMTVDGHQTLPHPISNQRIVNIFTSNSSWSVGSLAEGYHYREGLTGSWTHSSESRSSYLSSKTSFNGCLRLPYAEYDHTQLHMNLIPSEQWLENVCGLLDNECSPVVSASCGEGECVVNPATRRWVCDCRRTHNSGIACSNDDNVIAFYGTQGYQFPALPSHTLDVSLHFRSLLSSGMIFYMMDATNISEIILSIDNQLLLLEINAGNLPIDYIINPQWAVSPGDWNFVSIYSDGKTLVLTLNDAVYETTVSLPRWVFNSTEIVLGDTSQANAPQAFKGCISNVHLAIKAPLNHYSLGSEACPSDEVLNRVLNQTSTITPSTPIPFILVLGVDVVNIIKVDEIYDYHVNITFSIYIANQSGYIMSGYYDNYKVFTVLYESGFLFIQWFSLLDEPHSAYAEVGPLDWLVTVTIFRNSTVFGIYANNNLHNVYWGPNQDGFLANFNTLKIGGTSNSLEGIMTNLLVNNIQPHVLVRTMEEYSVTTKATLSSTVISPSTTVPSLSESDNMIASSSRSDNAASHSSSLLPSVTPHVNSPKENANHSILYSLTVISAVSAIASVFVLLLAVLVLVCVCCIWRSVQTKTECSSEKIRGCEHAYDGSKTPPMTQSNT